MDSEILLSNIPKQIPTYLYRKEFERTVNYAARCTATIFQKILAAPIYDIPGKKKVTNREKSVPRTQEAKNSNRNNLYYQDTYIYNEYI